MILPLSALSLYPLEAVDLQFDAVERAVYFFAVWAFPRFFRPYPEPARKILLHLVTQTAEKAVVNL